MIHLAEQWVSSNPPNVGFLQYAQDCDLYIGAPLAGARYGQLLPERNRRVLIPGFGFRGLQPDCFHLNGFNSVLGKGGSLYSRIVVASFRAGLTPLLTCKLFNQETYKAFDPLTCYDLEKQELIDRFGRYSIDLSGSLERWIARGNFLYSYNHPRIDVLMEILRRALVAAEILPISELERSDDMGVVDNLREASLWPIYPEIARLHGLDGSLTWRMGRAQNYKVLDLDQFVKASFEALTAKQLPEVPQLLTWVGLIKSLIAT